MKGLDQSWKLDGAYTEKHVHVHLTYEEMQQRAVELRAKVAVLKEELKESYIDELQTRHKQMLRLSYTKIKQQTEDGNANEILGFPLTDFMVADLKKIDLRTIRQKPVNHLLLIQDDKDAYIESLKEHLMRMDNHLEYRQLSNPKFWLEEPHKEIVPHQLLNSVVGWISEVY